MARKPKPPIRRPKPVIDKDTYTSAELCARYGCSQVTLRRLERDKGFPKGERVGKRLVYDKFQVHQWERKYHPGLHSSDELGEDAQDRKNWDLLIRRRALEREEEAASKKPN
jgi:hypothetical protein